MSVISLGVVSLAAAVHVWAQGGTVFEIHKVAEAHFQPAPEQPTFVLVIGTDFRPGVDGHRADSIHVVGVNPAAGVATILGIPRDTFVDIPGRGRAKINDAFNFGGPVLMANTVAQLTGIGVGYVISTDFAGFEAMVDELGGVSVNVPFPMRERLSGANFPQGPVHMNGAMALAFARNRHIPDGDIRRSLHQGDLIIAGLAKLRAERTGATGALRALAVLGRHADIHGVSLRELYRLGRLGLSIDPARVRNVVMPSSLGTAGAASVVFPAAGAAGLFADMRDDAVLQAH